MNSLKVQTSQTSKNVRICSTFMLMQHNNKAVLKSIVNIYRPECFTYGQPVQFMQDPSIKFHHNSFYFQKLEGKRSIACNGCVYTRKSLIHTGKQDVKCTALISKWIINQYMISKPSIPFETCSVYKAILMQHLPSLFFVLLTWQMFHVSIEKQWVLDHTSGNVFSQVSSDYIFAHWN